MSKFRFVVAAAVSLALGSVSLQAVSADQTVSAAVGPQFKAATDAMNAKNWDEMVRQAQAVIANPKKTPFDTLKAYELMQYAYAQQKNLVELPKVLQGQLDTGLVTPANQNKILTTMAAIYYSQKNYAQAGEIGQRLIKAGAADADTYTLVGQSLFQQGKYAETGKFISEYVNDQERRGQNPKENMLVLMLRSYEKAGDQKSMSTTFEKLVSHYPKAEYWDNLLFSLRRNPALSERQTLQLYRLMQATGTLKLGKDYIEMAEIAASSGVPGEAVRVLDQGTAANVFTEQREKDAAARKLASSKKVVDTDKAALAKLEADAKASKTGELDLAVGTSYFGNGDYPKAIEALNRSLTKGGLKNPVDAQLTIGVAQIRANNKAEAVKTFRAIKTDDAVSQNIAKLWVLYAS